jgi:hypothetical protein
MNKLVKYLESKEVVFHGALALIFLYVPHAGHLIKELEHIDMTVSGYSFLNWIYAIALAAIIEILILIFIINGYQKTGKVYAILSFFVNALYYDYWLKPIMNPSNENIRMMGASFLICLLHTVSIWQLSELFIKRLKADKEKKVEYICEECNAGPFPTKRSLEGHISKAHKYYRKVAENSKSYKPSLNGIKH